MAKYQGLYSKGYTSFEIIFEERGIKIYDKTTGS